MMFSSNKRIRIEKELYTKLQEKAGEGGYSSTDEFIVHILQKAVSGEEDELDRDQVDRQLRGLGYLE